ncbi:hypothetical protein FB451DRAFT_1178462 [Mycena latifolia]|nr:hypothetical protein FB451DRAFT_1178462 [Mycena latifolia]
MDVVAEELTLGGKVYGWTDTPRGSLDRRQWGMAHPLRQANADSQIIPISSFLETHGWESENERHQLQAMYGVEATTEVSRVPALAEMVVRMGAVGAPLRFMANPGMVAPATDLGRGSGVLECAITEATGDNQQGAHSVIASSGVAPSMRAKEYFESPGAREILVIAADERVPSGAHMEPGQNHLGPPRCLGNRSQGIIHAPSASPWPDPRIAIKAVELGLHPGAESTMFDADNNFLMHLCLAQDL